MFQLTKDSYMALIVIIIALIGLWNTWELDLMNGIFPKISSILLLLLGLIYLIISFFTKTNYRVFEEVNKKVVLTMGSGIVTYVILIWVIGFLIASLIFIAGSVWYLQGNKVSWKTGLFRGGISSIVVSIGFYLLFQGIFNVPLPNGYIF